MTPVEERLAAVEAELRHLSAAVAALSASVATLADKVADKAMSGAVHAATCDADRSDLRGDVARLEADVKANTRARWLVVGGSTAAGGVAGWLAKLIGGG